MVFVVSVALAVVHYIEPMSGPSLPIARRGEEFVNKFGICFGAGVFQEVVESFGREGHSPEIVGEASGESAFVRGLRRSEIEGVLLIPNEAVDGIPF